MDIARSDRKEHRTDALVLPLLIYVDFFLPNDRLIDLSDLLFLLTLLVFLRWLPARAVWRFQLFEHTLCSLVEEVLNNVQMASHYSDV